MVNVTDCADVNVWLVAVKFLFLTYGNSRQTHSHQSYARSLLQLASSEPEEPPSTREVWLELAPSIASRFVVAELRALSRRDGGNNAAF